MKVKNPGLLRALLGVVLCLTLVCHGLLAEEPLTVDPAQIAPTAVTSAVHDLLQRAPKRPIEVICGEGTGAMAKTCERVREALERDRLPPQVHVENLEAPTSAEPPPTPRLSDWKGPLSVIRVLGSGIIFGSVVAIGAHGGILAVATIGAIAASWSGLMQYHNSGYLDWLSQSGWITIRDPKRVADALEKNIRRFLPGVREHAVSSVVEKGLRALSGKRLPFLLRHLGPLFYVGDAEKQPDAGVVESILKKMFTTAIYGVLIHAGYSLNGLEPFFTAAAGHKIVMMTGDSVATKLLWTKFNAKMKKDAIKNDPQNKIYYERASGVGSFALSSSNVVAKALTLDGQNSGEGFSVVSALTGAIFYLGAKYWNHLPKPVQKAVQASWRPIRATGAKVLRSIASTTHRLSCRSALRTL